MRARHLVTSLAGLLLCLSGTRSQDERFEYAAVCPPSQRDDLTGSGCDITMLSSIDQNDVLLESINGVEQIQLQANVPFIRTVDPSFHVDSGFESKGIIISAFEELVITVIKRDEETGNDQFVDAYQVFDQRLAGYEYFMLLKTQGCNDPAYVKSFMTIVPFFDDTTIELYDPDGTFVGQDQINRLQTFTLRTTDSNDDFSGMRVITNYATLGVTGSVCVDNSVSAEPESYITSLQPILFYGLEYVTPTVGGSPTSGYGLRVLAAETDTVVSHEGNQNILNKGEVWEIIYPTNEFATLFTCSKPCLVVQWSDGPDIGNFMFNVFALSQFTKIAQFTTLDFEGTHYVSIVVYGFPPMDDIFLDEQPLNDETWKVRSMYSYTELEITPGVHRLYTSGEKTFGAYVYCHFSSGKGGYGYSVFPQDIENLPMPTTPESTVTIPTTTEIPEPRNFEYIAVCPPSQREDLVGSACNITFLSSVDNFDIKVSTYDGVELIDVEAGVPYTRTIDEKYQVDEGLEYKGIIIESYEELVITVIKLDNETGSDQFIDTYQAYDARFAGREYYIATKTQRCPSDSYVKSFVSVMSFNDTTFVEVYDKEGFREGTVLNRYQTFTMRTTRMNDDFTGMRVKLSQKCLVVTGTLCAGNYYNGELESYVTNLQPVFLYGTEYVTPSIGGSLVAGYGLRVVASQDGTTVRHEGTNNLLNEGEFWEIQYNISDTATLFQCNKPCLVIQWSDSPAIGNFMFNVYALSQFSQAQAYFHTVDFDGAHWVSIVVSGFPPMDDFFLDDRSLDDETWRVRAAYSYIELPVSPGVHKIHTTHPTKTFSAYVYCHVGSDPEEEGPSRGGYGYSMYPQGLTDVPQEPPYIVTTPDPSENYEYAVVCPPHQNTTDTELTGCDIVITAAYQDAIVNISTIDYFQQVLVEFGSPYTLELNHTLVIDDGVEMKGIIIVSTVQLSVVVYKTDLSGEDVFVDATQAYSLEMAGFDYFILTESIGCQESSSVNGFFSIVGHWDSSFIQIFDAENEFLMAIVLQRYQVYTLKTTDHTVLYSGIYIDSIYPVSIYAGSMCVEEAQTGIRGTYFSTLLPVIHYGTEYSTPAVQEPTSGGYGISVLAARDNTVVGFEGQTRVINVGESIDIAFRFNEYASMVTCSHPCALLQHTKSMTGEIIGNFQMSILATAHFMKSAVFSTSPRYAGHQHYLSIMVYGYPPMDDILLDGQTLQSKTWKFRNTYTYVDFDISPGQHVLESTSDKTFAAYVYCHTGNGGGFGYPIWPADTLVGSTGSPPSPLDVEEWGP